MRPCEFFEWNPKTLTWGGPFNGQWHCWGSSFVEFESGPGNHSIGIVETEDGRAHEILPKKIRFTVKPASGEGEGKP